MADLQRQLSAKQKELNDLKASFDEYMASSKELELELETSLDDAENRYSAAMKQNKLFEARISDLNSKISAGNAEKEKLHASIAQMRASADKTSITIKSLEISNEELTEKVRMLEFSNNDLTLKLEDSDEALIILRETADTGENGNELRLKAELTELQAELARADIELAEYKEKENEHIKREKELARKSSKGAYYEEEFAKAQTQISVLETKLQRSQQEVAEVEAELADMRQNVAAHGHSGGGTGSGGEMEHKAKRRLSARSAAAATKGNEVVESFESVVEDLYERLGDSEEENRELLEALEVTQEDLMRNHQTQVQAIQAAAEMEVILKKAEDRVDELENKLIEKNGALEDLSKSVDILKNRLEQKGVEMKEVEKEWERKLKDSLKNVERRQVENDMLKQQIRALEMGSLKVNTEDDNHVGVEKVEARLAEVVAEFKKSTTEWAKERSALFEDRASLLQEIDDLRAIRGMEKFEFVSSLPQTEAVPKEEEVPELIDTSGRARVAAEQAIASNDLERLKDELLHQLDRYEELRGNNAKLLHNLQTAKGNIQVCCRARPPNDEELGQGAGISLDMVDDGEIACFDRRAMQWRSFTFDKVWDEDASQADVFADIEPLALSVVDGYNACILAYGQTGSGKTFTMNGYGTDYGVSYRTLHQMFELLNLKKTRAENMESRKQTARRRNKHGRALMSSSREMPVDEAEVGDDQNDELSAQDSSCHTYDGERSAQDDEVSSSSATQENGPLCEGTSTSRTHIGNKTCNRTKKRESGLWSSKSNASFQSPAPTEVGILDHTFQISYSVEVSMLEIYNESVHDLLVPQLNGHPGDTAPSMDIRHDADGSVNVPGLIKEPVSNLEEVMQVFKRGSANRATTATSLNEHSSRSHSILIVYVTTTSNNGLPVTGKLYLVDLAGSERMGKSGVTGQAMKETQHINKSLSALGDVMEGLDKKSKHIPFRNSKLTYLLQDSLGGNSRTMMIVTVCPTELSADETLFALQFATRARNIQLGTARRNVSVKGMEESVKHLRHELKEERKKSAHLQDIITDMRRESRQKRNKISHQMDTKIRNIDETRKGAELQIEVLTRTNAELIARLQEEKEQHRLVTADSDKIQKSLKKIDEQLRTMSRDKDRAYAALQARDKENEGLRNLVRSLKDPSVATDTIHKARGTPKTPVHSTPSSNKFLAHGQTRSGKKTAPPMSTPASTTRTKPNRPKTIANDTTRCSVSTSTPHGENGEASPVAAFGLDDGSDQQGVGTEPSYLRPTTASRMHNTPETGVAAVSDQNDSRPSPGLAAGGRFKKETVTAMATSRAQEAMLRHQERMKKKREARGSSGGDRSMHF